MPHLRWLFDESYEESIRLEEIISQARARDKEINPELEFGERRTEVDPDAGQTTEVDGDGSAVSEAQPDES